VSLAGNMRFPILLCVSRYSLIAACGAAVESAMTFTSYSGSQRLSARQSAWSQALEGKACPGQAPPVGHSADIIPPVGGQGLLLLAHGFGRQFSRSGSCFIRRLYTQTCESSSARAFVCT
jgi:hypothetical protein